MKRRFLSFTILSVCVVVSASAAGRRGPAYAVSAARDPLVIRSAATITAAELKDYLSFVASDLMEGRADPSRGLDTTALFLATALSRAGATPAGDDGSFFQRITLKRDRVVEDGTYAEVNGTRFAYAKDFVVAPPAARGVVTGPMVFAADGWFVKSRNADAYRTVDPKGKIAIVVENALPWGVSRADIRGKEGEDYMGPQAYARQKGAIAVIVLRTLNARAMSASDDRMRKQAEEPEYYPERLPGPTPELPTMYVHASVADAIFEGERATARAVLNAAESEARVKPFELTPSRRMSFAIRTATEKVVSQNVVAVVEGSDPALRREYVALGAHYDHVGIGRPVNGDAIYNGADDDGSGTVALLAMAEALENAPRRPKRSVLLVWHMGEEMGLWGSRYFTTFPTVPLERVVAQLNIDMIGRSRPPDDEDPRDRSLSGPNETYVIGSKMMSTQLGELTAAVNDSYAKLSYNYRYDDPKDPEQFFYRSDHINYARKGIPIVFYFTGVHRDYHQPGDEVSKIDFRKYEAIARTIYVTMWEIGEMKARPVVDKPLASTAGSR